MVRLLVGVSLIFGTGSHALAEGLDSLFPGPIAIAHSKPLLKNQVQFVAIAQTHWIPAQRTNVRNRPRMNEVLIQLQITNFAKKKMSFPTDNCISARLTKKDGDQVSPTVNRGYTAPTSPIVLNPNGTYTLCRRGEIRAGEKESECEFVFHCGVGQTLCFERLEPGEYRLSLGYGGPANQKTQNADDESLSAWNETIFTHEVPITIHAKAAGGWLQTGQELPLGRRPREIVESPPVEKNNAQFVIAADAQWKFSSDPTPIDVQLRISNLSKEDMVFRTFDSFHLMLTDKKGKSIRVSGGRDATRYTAPVQIPPGATIALCHQAELHTESKTGNRFDYFDGTGSWASYGPLKPDGYSLSFAYVGSSNTKYPNEAHPQLWRGAVMSKAVAIEAVLNRR